MSIDFDTWLRLLLQAINPAAWFELAATPIAMGITGWLLLQEGQPLRRQFWLGAILGAATQNIACIVWQGYRIEWACLPARRWTTLLL